MPRLQSACREAAILHVTWIWRARCGSLIASRWVIDRQMVALPKDSLACAGLHTAPPATANTHDAHRAIIKVLAFLSFQRLLSAHHVHRGCHFRLVLKNLEWIFENSTDIHQPYDLELRCAINEWWLPRSNDLFISTHFHIGVASAN